MEVALHRHCCGPALVMTVEVPQIQLLDDGMVGYRWAWCLVRQWIHGLRQLSGAFGWVLHILYELGNWTLRPEPLESGSSLFAVWVYSSWVGCARVLRSVSLWKNFLFDVDLLAQFALGNSTFSSALVSFSPFRCWVLPLEYTVSGTRALLGSTVDTCSKGRLWMNFTYFLRCGELES